VTVFSLTLAATLSLSLAFSNSPTHANSEKLRPTRPLVGATPSAGEAHAPAAKLTARAGVPTPPPVENYAHLPLSFERNDGQAGAEVKFLARGRGYKLLLTTGAARLMLNRRSHASPTHQGRAFDGLAAEDLSVALGACRR
jgi:hypothetical protein